MLIFKIINDSFVPYGKNLKKGNEQLEKKKGNFFSGKICKD